MTLPVQVTVQGVVQDSDGPVAGRFVFSRDTALFPASSSDLSFPIPEEIETIVGADGVFAQPLYATNDPAVSPTGWTWEVRTHFSGWRTTFSIVVPYDAVDATVNLNELAPVPPDGTGVLYALANHTHAGGGGGGAVDSVFGRTGAVTAQSADYTKTQVGLGSVDNTADIAKPVSTAQQTALNLKANIASPTFTGTVGGITKSMVGLGSVDNTADTAKPVSTAQQTALDLKAPLASPTFTGTVSGVSQTMVGLGSVDNTSDAAKPVSTAQQTALNLKANIASPTFTGTVAGITKSMVGLGSVDNTADTAKPVSTAQQTALDLKANLASPALTGTPTAPTAAGGTNTTQVATTAFATAGISALTKVLVLAAADSIPGGTAAGTVIVRTAT